MTDKPGYAVLEARLAGRTVRRGADECWTWTGSLDSDGYGRIGVNGRTTGAHRLAYELAKGPIPKGLEIDHLCRVPRCVNPAHLEAVTHAENIRRSDPASWPHNQPRSHCKRGHEFTPENTVVSRTQRKCRICRKASNKRYQEKLRAALALANEPADGDKS